MSALFLSEAQTADETAFVTHLVRATSITPRCGSIITSDPTSMSHLYNNQRTIALLHGPAPPAHRPCGATVCPLGNNCKHVLGPDSTAAEQNPRRAAEEVSRPSWDVASKWHNLLNASLYREGPLTTWLVWRMEWPRQSARTLRSQRTNMYPCSIHVVSM